MLFISLLMLEYDVSQAKNYQFKNVDGDLNSTLTTVFEGNQTWYGDFIVNETDIVTIQNCNFIVENGFIYVNGTLNVINSTIWMQNVSSRYKNVNVYGNFTITNSTILGNNVIVAFGNSHVLVENSSLPTTRLNVYREGKVHVYGSSLRLIYTYGEVQMSNSNLSGIMYFLNTNSKFFASSSYINCSYILELDYHNDLKIRPGFIESFTIYSAYNSANFTISQTTVEDWYIHCLWFEGKFLDSLIGTLDFTVDPTWSGNLTLASSYIEYLNLNFSYPPFIIEKSTVLEWRISVWGNTSVQLLNSENVDLDVFESPRVSILDSYVIYICVYEDFYGSLSFINATINSFNIRFKDSQSNLNFKEGFNEFFSIYISEHECNITLVNSQVYHWRIDAYKNSTLYVFNSTLTAGLWCPYNLKVTMNSSCSVYNSDIEVIYCAGSTYYHYQSYLTIVNCTVKTLYAYDANVTAINSTINMLITDPTYVNLVNSCVLLVLDFPIEMSDEDCITSQFMEEFDPSLPENIQRFSDYVNITSAYQDYLEFQVKISYNETEVKQVGINEDQLQIYYLDDSHVWRLCQIQEVNTVENYVWANVTSFSCFVLGFRAIVKRGGGPGRLITVLV